MKFGHGVFLHPVHWYIIYKRYAQSDCATILLCNSNNAAADNDNNNDNDDNNNNNNHEEYRGQRTSLYGRSRDLLEVAMGRRSTA